MNGNQALERDGTVRWLSQPGATVVRTAEQLGMGCATVYRKLAQYGRGSLQTQGILLLMLTADLRFRRSAHRSAQEDS